MFYQKIFIATKIQYSDKRISIYNTNETDEISYINVSSGKIFKCT